MAKAKVPRDELMSARSGGSEDCPCVCACVCVYVQVDVAQFRVLLAGPCARHLTHVTLDGCGAVTGSEGPNMLLKLGRACPQIQVCVCVCVLMSVYVCVCVCVCDR